MTPEERLSTFDSKKFETFVLQWADEYLRSRYDLVECRGGANDKGRDVVAWIDPPGTPNRRYDTYQCKYYGDKLTPGEFWEELAKLCHYTYTGEINIPNRYVLMTSKGVGSSLSELIDAPHRLRKELLQRWEGKGIKGAGKHIPEILSGDFKKYVEAFDFSIVESVPPGEFIKQHQTTKYHAHVFGIVTEKERPVLQPPAEIDETRESIYIKLALEAYGDACNKAGYTQTDLDSFPHFKDHLAQTRIDFYSAEALKEFSRDNYIETAFDSLLTQFEAGIKPTYTRSHANAFERLLNVTQTASLLPINHSLLQNEVSANDRIGICHHLANNGRITSWIFSYYGTNQISSTSK
ncbi:MULTISPECIES: ABC-three component system protein [unclassified Hymenobacter]|uniref:ABC-three component system protein n=1 Tax=unclassified Hymenobacter TaxID=2615202 RepID=UPI0016534E7A|nr:MULTISPECIES: ABC-three component system protein [unclassified Hymenobacter]MBC6992169.1 hypothetical protein [Hymenobacter sp. BT491]MCC3154738.1 restriction endonuclease [Hymenobacter sp. BT770]MDO3416547.1 hypothetical protein [Hymenobacter sp. BT770]